MFYSTITQAVFWCDNVITFNLTIFAVKASLFASLLHYVRLMQVEKKLSAATRQNRSSGFPTRSDINQPVKSQKQARGLLISDLGRSGIVLCASKKKGADRLLCA